MTKEIIIDGVNVAGCNFRLEREDKQKCECTHATGFGVICDCENWHNCYFKQLKRLEQERDELKQVKDKYYQQTLDNEITISNLIEEIQGLKADRTLERISKLCIENARLEQENKELKIWLESKEKQLKHLIEYNQNKKDQIKTLKFMLFDEKEIPKDKFTMMYRIAQNERRTRSHRDLCTNITKKYRSALEEIRENLVKLKTNDEDDFTYEYSKIEDKINEVLN